MANMAINAIQTVNNGQLAFCKFLSANDTGDTGGHQAGIYITKNAISIMFDKPFEKGTNKERYVKIKWQDDFITESRFIYYGTGTRNEYRITRFQRGFPFLTSDHTGDLFVLVKNDFEDYSGFILDTEDDINAFLDSFAMGPTDTGALINKKDIQLEARTESFIKAFIVRTKEDFPSSFDMSNTARSIYNEIYNHEENIIADPDNMLLNWIEIEYHIFRKIEFNRYGHMIENGFSSVEQFIDIANSVLNRRKSRAGKSLEHHLTAMFDGNSLAYSSQPITEGNKRPDFIFPSEAAYHDYSYANNKLIFLGAKTTCKDRWRQIINEANRIPNKHLFTLQQSISTKQLDEMESENIILVVPEYYIGNYPKEKRHKIWTLRKFIAFVKEKTML